MNTRQQIHLTSRHVCDCGETLVVRDFDGHKALVDPCYKDVHVQVPNGRNAVLVRFSLNGLPGRDAHVRVIHDHNGFGFAIAKHPHLHISLQALCEGQLVDVLPSAEPKVAYAVLNRPLPVLRGAVTAEPPVYALVA